MNKNDIATAARKGPQQEADILDASAIKADVTEPLPSYFLSHSLTYRGHRPLADQRRSTFAAQYIETWHDI